MSTHAQQKLPVVSSLSYGYGPPPERQGRSPLRQRLRELGWEEGKTVQFELAFTDGRDGRLPALAATRVEKKVDLIVTWGANGARAARQATDTIPIIAVGPDEARTLLQQQVAAVTYRIAFGPRAWHKVLALGVQCRGCSHRGSLRRRIEWRLLRSQICERYVSNGSGAGTRSVWLINSNAVHTSL